MKYDAVIIGGGPGGYVCALRCAQYGLRTALVEKDLLGGSCVNRGCVPAKTLLFAGRLLNAARKGKEFGIAAEAVGPDYEALRARCAEMAAQLRGNIQKWLRQREVDVYSGTGRVTGKGEVTVSSGSRETVLAADNIVLAVGSVPEVPPIRGADLAGVYTSDTLLTDLPRLQSLLIVGGGVVGAELAEAYRSFGTNVTILEESPRLLAPMDADLARRMTADFRRKGVEIRVKTPVTGIEKQADGLHVRYTASGRTCEAVAEGVLLACRRRCVTEGLLPFAVKMDKGRIAVDSRCHTTAPHVYAVGDITAGFPQLAHTAEAQGKIAAAAIAGRDCPIRMDLIPSVVYTSPEIASVGLTRETARKKRLSVRVTKSVLGGNARRLIAGEEGYIKLITGEDGRLLGAGFQCENASDLVGEATLAIAGGMTAETLGSIIRPHPSMEEAMGEAADSACGMAVRSVG